MLMPGILAACSPAAPLNFLARGGDWTISSEKYGNNARNDIYRPTGANNAPVIVFFYGGNWQSGDKETYRFVAAGLAARGYVAVVPDYRLYPEVRFAGFMEDGAQAVAWTKRNIGRFGGDPGAIFLMGHSAGAHIVALLTLDGQWIAKLGLNSRRDIAGFIGIAGPYDFLPLKDETLKVIFSGGDMSRTQPITFVAGGEPPAMLVAGVDDETVDPRNTTRLAARLRARGGDVTEVEYPSIGHAAIIGAFSPLLQPLAPVLNDVDAFVAAQAKGHRAPSKFAR
jgi:acetyl esterase/lipase